MKKNLVFYQGRLYHAYAQAPMYFVWALPDGAYIRTVAGEWYRKEGLSQPIAQEAVPKEVLTLALLLT